MADESTAAVSQPSTAGDEQAAGTVMQDYSSFLGPPSAEADLSEEERSAPDSEEEAEGEPEPQQQPQRPGEGEPEEEEEAPAQQATQEAEEEAEQPPSVEERLKDLTQREADDYARRYPNAWKALLNPQTPEDMKHLLLDKIDGDHEIQRRIAQEQQALEEEPTLEYEQEQPEQQVQPQDAAEQRTAYYSQIDNMVQASFDPQFVKEFGDSLLRAFNVNMKALDDPNVTPEDKAILKGLADSAQKEAPVIARFMVDAVSTTVPQILRPVLEAQMPGFVDMYERHMYGTAWEGIRSQTDERGHPLYPGLTAWPAISGTSEARAFEQKMMEAADQIPGFDDMVFRDQHGRILPQAQQAQLKYTLLARQLSGQRINPAVVAQAVETGRRLESRAGTRRQAARVTGAGQRTAGPAGGAQGEEDDPMMAALDHEIARQEGNYRQVVRGRTSSR
jgi:hypothetical protein